jgi:hypothetical protein
MLATTLIAIGLMGFLFWKWRPRRPEEPGFKFVYVNQDGSVRELSPEERAYLSKEFPGGDSGRPYVKTSYESRDGWGSRSGFIVRRRVPARLVILPVHPNFDAAVKELGDEFRDDRLGASEDIVTENADGSIAYYRSTDTSRQARKARKAQFKPFRDNVLAQQRRREELAKL